jgi:hypothetical protein
MPRLSITMPDFHPSTERPEARDAKERLLQCLLPCFCFPKNYNHYGVIEALLGLRRVVEYFYEKRVLNLSFNF